MKTPAKPPRPPHPTLGTSGSCDTIHMPVPKSPSLPRSPATYQSPANYSRAIDWAKVDDADADSQKTNPIPPRPLIQPKYKSKASLSPLPGTMEKPQRPISPKVPPRSPALSRSLTPQLQDPEDRNQHVYETPLPISQGHQSPITHGAAYLSPGLVHRGIYNRSPSPSFHKSDFELTSQQPRLNSWMSHNTKTTIKSKALSQDDGNLPARPALPPPRPPAHALSHVYELEPPALPTTSHVTDHKSGIASRGRSPPPRRPPFLPRPPLSTAPAIYRDTSAHEQPPAYLDILPDKKAHQSSSQYNQPSPYLEPLADVTVPQQKQPYYKVHRGTLPISQSEPSQQTAHSAPNHQSSEDFEQLATWWKTRDSLEFPPPSHCSLGPEEETRRFNQKAHQVRMGLDFFSALLLKRGESLRSQIAELHNIADNLDKISKRNRVMGITGGTTGAVGGVAAVVGIVLAPVTMGASLAVTAVGSGMALAGGGMGAGAAITNKRSTSVERRRVERIVQGYKADVLELERSLVFVQTGMEALRRHDYSRYRGASAEAVWMTRVADAVCRLGGGTSARQGIGRSDGVLRDFTGGMELYFTDDDSAKLKKGSETRFANNIRAVAEQLQDGLDDVNRAWTTFSLAASSV
ncbi:lysine-specific demethylase 6B-like isoform X2 [Denticeps clupeoides]|uniref:lysine-specific demethylase 6B-like isoform X2 n=1 Tax=Denticeps clupeoides TaxID=299321 RepID=UPI0010A4DA56|nr:lysine-specific demethylase 6B-like isoform X2 [Denticeps clupeoides]